MKKLFYVANLLTLCFIFSSEAARAQAPAITRQPRADTACVADTARFTVASSDTLASFVWEVYNGTSWDTVHNGGAYAGATNDTLWVVASAALNGNWYKAVAYNDSGATSSDSARLVVNPLPFAGGITGPATVCHTGMIMLSDTAAGGVWTSSNSSATVSSTGMVMGMHSGMDTIRYTVTNTCGTAVVSHIIRVEDSLTHDVISGPVAVCVGSSITLTVGVAGGTWRATNGNATVSSAGAVTGVASGRDTIIYTNTNSCNADTTSAVVTVDTALAATSVSGPARVCVGSWVAFTSTGSGGIWLSSNSMVASTDSVGNVTGRGQGTAIISYTHSNACGTVAGMDTIVVERNASSIVGSDSVGVGNIITLSDSASGGSWAPSDTLIATVTGAGVVTGVAPGTATIRFTVTNICGTSSVTKTITVGDAPLITDIIGADSVCGGSTTAYSDSFMGGTWSVVNGAGSIDAAGMFHANDTGAVRDTILYTFTNGFGSVTIRKVVYIMFAPPRITITPISAILVIGNPYTLIATPTGGTWVSLNPARVALTTATNFTPLRPGTADLVYTYSNACGSSNDTLHLIVPGVDNVNSINGTTEALNVYPNPNSGSFVLNFASSYNESAHVVITNLLGATVKEMDVTTNKLTAVSVGQAKGIYFVTATSAHSKISTRITVAE